MGDPCTSCGGTVQGEVGTPATVTDRVDLVQTGKISVRRRPRRRRRCHLFCHALCLIMVSNPSAKTLLPNE